MMSLDFFDRQDVVRRRSYGFLAAFSLATVLASIIIYIVISLLSSLPFTPSAFQSFIWEGYLPSAFTLKRFLIITPIVVGTIFIVARLKYRTIEVGGGVYIAQCLGGELLEENPSDRKHRELLNVIEEMAIAAGLPMPLVFVMPSETGINAMTAGLDREDAVIVVSQGALDNLTRDELQGVMAHEFAHILSGDCAVNALMAGCMAGLMFFSVLGRQMWKSAYEICKVGGIYKNHPAMIIFGYGALILFAGLVLYVTGLAGKWLGAVVQAAFSRQREYLADAFAVQFTRNPEGLSGALKKIFSCSQKSVIRAGAALTFKPFFIANPIRFDGWFKSHPPLEDRIRVFKPNWDGQPVDMRKTRFSETAQKEKTHKTWLNGLAPALVSVLYVAGAGATSPQNKDMTVKINKSIPSELKAAAKDVCKMPVLAAVVLFYSEPNLLNTQLVKLRPFLTEAEVNEAVYLYRTMAHRESRLALLDLAAMTLKNVGDDGRDKIEKIMTAMSLGGQHIEFYEIAATYMLRRLISSKAPDEEFAPDKIVVDKARIKEAMITALSIMAWAGAADEETARWAFARGISQLTNNGVKIKPKKMVLKPETVNHTLRILGKASSADKDRMLRAVITTALHNRQIGQSEYEFMRALEAAMEMTLPALNMAVH